jgi:hypothetical protein
MRDPLLWPVVASLLIIGFVLKLDCSIAAVVHRAAW